MNSEDKDETVEKKQPKRGIIYLATIPPNMNVTKIREVFSEYGTIGRVYLQLPETKVKPGQEKKKKKFSRRFTEGWIEFKRKSVAKKVATLLNNTQVSLRKKSKHYDCLWSIKYLSNFKWTHLHERLAYEKQARRQKLRAEIQLAKKQTNFFSINLDRHKNKKQFVNKDLEKSNTDRKEIPVSNESENVEERQIFLKSLFK